LGRPGDLIAIVNHKPFGDALRLHDRSATTLVLVACRYHKNRASGCRTRFRSMS